MAEDAHANAYGRSGTLTNANREPVLNAFPRGRAFWALVRSLRAHVGEGESPFKFRGPYLGFLKQIKVTLGCFNQNPSPLNAPKFNPVVPTPVDRQALMKYSVISDQSFNRICSTDYCAN